MIKPRYFYFLCSFFLLLPTFIQAQIQQNEKLQVKIIKFENIFSNTISIEISVTGQYNLNNMSFDHITPIVNLCTKNNTTESIYSDTAMFFSVDKQSLVEGIFTDTISVKIPINYLSQREALYFLDITLRGHNHKIKVQTGTFTTADIEKKINKKIYTLYHKVKTTQVLAQKKGLTFTLNFNTNDEALNSCYVQLYKDNKPCATVSEQSSFSKGIPSCKVYIDYATIALPKGKYTLSYKVFATINNKEQELGTYPLDIEQPQLYWLAFESKNANIDVSNMDPASGFGSLFSSNAGRGLGDAYYKIESNKKPFFYSVVASHSGAIPNTKGRIQVHLGEVYKVVFYDKDITSDDYLGEFSFPVKAVGKEAMSIKNNGKIINFDFNYNLEPVTAENYLSK